MKNILVTGGAGFIGSNFVRHMVATYPEYLIVVYDKLTYAGNLDNLLEVDDEPNYRFVKADICDPEQVEETIRRHEIDTVVNFAAETHVDRSIMDPDAFVHTDVLGTYTLLEAARKFGVERYHQVSSVTGDTPIMVRDEETGVIALRPIESLDEDEIARYSALTMTDDYRVRFRRMKHFIKHPADEVYEITYNGGGRIRATGSHSVFVFEDGKLTTKPSSELRAGDLMITFLGTVDIEREPYVFDLAEVLADYTYDGMDEVLRRRLDVFETLRQSPLNSAGLRAAFAESIASTTTYRIATTLAEDGYLQKSPDGVYTLTAESVTEAVQNVDALRWDLIRRKLHIRDRLVPVTPRLMQVFGCYLAEGHCSHTPNELKLNSRTVTFTVGRHEPDVLQLLISCAREELGIEPYVHQRGSTIQITYSSYWVHSIFAQFGATAETKRFPSWLWTQPRGLIEAFFQGYEGDAAVKRDGRRYFTTVNRGLAESLVWLARMNDINCLWSTRVVQQVKGKVPPGVTVTRQRRFYDLQVTSEHYRRAESGPWRTPMARCVPTSAVRRALGCRQHQGITIGYKPMVSKERALSLAATFEQIPKDLENLLDSPVGVAKIKAIRRIKQDVMVYDVSVPGNERFFGGNVPVLLHNTDEVYGHIEGDHRSKESDALVPRSPYSATKASGDLLAHAYFVTYGLPVTITRGANNIGPYQYPEKVVPLFTTNALQDRPLPLYGDGRQKRDYHYVLDHCRAIELVLHKGQLGEAYNVGTGSEMENREMVRVILDELGKPESLIQHVEDRAGHDRRYALDVSKIRALGWEPHYTCEEAIRATVRWYVANEWWWRKVRNRDFEAYYQSLYGNRKILDGVSAG